MYALRFICSEVRSHDGITIMAHEGEKWWMCRGEWGYTGILDTGRIPPDVVAFPTKEAAQEWMRWEGHPWWVQPVSCELIAIKPRMVTVQQGWERG